MNKLTITQKGLAFLQSLSDTVKPASPKKEPAQVSVPLPSLKREKIEKLHRSKNRKFEMTAERVHEKYRSIQDLRSSAYDKENDGFWNEWHAGFQLAEAWNKENNDSRSRYQQRVKERTKGLSLKRQGKLSSKCPH